LERAIEVLHFEINVNKMLEKRERIQPIKLMLLDFQLPAAIRLKSPKQSEMKLRGSMLRMN
jgi:hypothetical protein